MESFGETEVDLECFIGDGGSDSDLVERGRDVDVDFSDVSVSVVDKTFGDLGFLPVSVSRAIVEVVIDTSDIDEAVDDAREGEVGFPP